MKTRRSLFVIISFLLLGLIGLWYWNSRAHSSKTAATNRAIAGNGSTSKVSAQAATSTRGPNYQPTKEELQAFLNSPDRTPEEKQFLEKNPDALMKYFIFYLARDAANSQLINVYGKVVDQDGQPVAGAAVKGGTLLVVSADASGGQEYTTTTDAQGLFNFTNLHGTRFGVHLEKAGYEYNPKLYLTWWDTYKPDPANPMVFTMYKLQGAEPMMHIKFGRTIPCDGTEVRYNLLTGKEVASGGDLIVSFIRNPVDIKRGTPFEWTLTLQAPGGGLVEIHDPYSYEAPESGYQETVTIGTGPDPKNYTDSTTKNYYYKSADGKYGRLFIDLQADFQPPPTSFDGSIYLNPSGSRNLEFDPAKQIKP